MNNVIDQLKNLISTYRQEFSQLSDDILSHKPNPAKWSKKEIIGHLIDSAHNNYRRFITGQYEKPAPHIWYEQDFWVAQNEYQKMRKEDLIQLWVLMNERICIVLRNMNSESYTKLCDWGRDSSELRSLEYIAEDYIVHMKHHLKQIFPEQI